MNKVNFSIVGKDGTVQQDLSFDDFDTLADHMMDVASKWYEGVYDPDDSMKVERFDENDNLILTEERKFGEDINDEFDGEEFNLNLPELPDLGSTNKRGRGKPKGFG